MDTRTKILTTEQALVTARGRTVFVAYFDVLTSTLTRRLCEVVGTAGVPLTVVVLDPPNPLLSLQARAELAASLACVEAVVPLPGDPTPFLQLLNPANIIHWESEDSARTAQLVEHVQTRYRSE